jgi:hypothetical protein
MIVVVSGVQREQGGSLRHRDNYGIGNPKFRKIVKIVNRGSLSCCPRKDARTIKDDCVAGGSFVFGMHGANCAESFGI